MAVGCQKMHIQRYTPKITASSQLYYIFEVNRTDFVVCACMQDPKEYIPFLNQLRQLDDNYCKFTIDSYLKNYTSALQRIVLCGMCGSILQHMSVRIILLSKAKISKS